MEFMLSLLCFFKNYKRAPSFRNAFIMLSLGCFSKKNTNFTNKVWKIGLIKVCKNRPFFLNASTSLAVA